MKIILPAAYLMIALVLLAAALIFPAATLACKECAGALAVHLVFVLAAAFLPMVPAGRIIAWTWTSISAAVSCALLTAHAFGEGDGWLLAAIALGALSLFLTLVFAMAFKPNGVASA